MLYTYIRGIQVELIEDVLLFRSDDLYCHGVLHLKQQGLGMYLIEKDNRVNQSYIFLLTCTHNCIEIIFIIVHVHCNYIFIMNCVK